MMNKKSLILVVLLIISLLLLPGCNRPQNQTPQVPAQDHLNYAITSIPKSLDPALMTEPTAVQLANALYEGLVRLKPDGTYEKAMALDWQVENQGSKYIFKLRPTKWSGGQPVTAQDFVYAWKRILNPATKSPFAYLFYDIKNAEGYHRSEQQDYTGRKAKEDEVAIKALDEETLVVELVKPNPLFTKKLSHFAFFPLKNGTTEFNPAASDFVGNGPFKIGAIVDQEQIIKLLKNEGYWDQEQVKLASMNWLALENESAAWQAYEKGQVDVVTSVAPSQLTKDSKEKQIQKAPLLATYFYQYNVAQKPFNDARVRKALAYGLDRQELLAKILPGQHQPALAFVPEGIKRERGEDYRQLKESFLPENNLAEAERLLAEAGYPKGQGFPKIQFLVDKREEQQIIAQALKDQWQKNLGLEVELISLEWQELVEKTRKRDFQLSRLGWFADYPEPSEFLKLFLSGTGANDTGWRNRDYDAILKKALATEGEKERMEAYLQAETILLQDMPLLPIFYFTRNYAVKPHLEGIYLPPVGATVEFKWAKTR